MGHLFFHLVFVVVLVAFTAIRMYYHRLARRTQGKVEYREGRLHTALRVTFGIPYMVAVVAYMVSPSVLAWADVPLSDGLRWVGAALALTSIPLIAWVQWALGSNFATTLHVREEHTLVTHGPYRWVRHPMYTVFFIQAIGLFLLTGNWLIGGVYVVAVTLIVVTRLRNEEAAMLEKFGDGYRAYIGRTGRFVPRVPFGHS